MTSRRLIVSSAAAVALGGALRPVVAQAFKAPDPAELRDVLRASPPRIEPIIRGTTALRTLLWQVEPARRVPDPLPKWRNGSERMGPLLQLVSSADAQAMVLKNLDDAKTLETSRASTARAIEPARRMEEALKSGGLAPGSALSIFLFRSFFQFDQFLVVQGQTKQSWYCEVYPFSVFCL